MFDQLERHDRGAEIRNDLQSIYDNLHGDQSAGRNVRIDQARRAGNRNADRQTGAAWTSCARHGRGARQNDNANDHREAQHTGCHDGDVVCSHEARRQRKPGRFSKMQGRKNRHLQEA
jgi:hypothetical protein